MSRSPWRDALDGKIKIIRGIRTPRTESSLLSYFSESEQLGSYQGQSKQAAALSLAQTYLDLIDDGVRQAEPFSMTNDQYDYIIRQYGLAGSDPKNRLVQRPFSITDPPLSPGLLWLPSTVDVYTEHEPDRLACAVRAIYWGTATLIMAPNGQVTEKTAGMTIISFVDPEASGWGMQHFRPGELLPIVHPYWPEGITLHDLVIEIKARYPDEVDQAMHLWPIAFLAVLFDSMRERILLWGGSGLEREARKQAARHKIGSTVQVVTWRKAEYQYPDGHVPKPVEWACRWIVREHVRRYKSGKVVVIRPYIKGPEGRDFKQPDDRVNIMRR